MPFRNWSSIWSLPSQPLEANELGITDDNAAIDAVSLTLVPYGAAKVYKLSMFPFMKQTSEAAQRL